LGTKNELKSDLAKVKEPWTKQVWPFLWRKGFFWQIRMEHRRAFSLDHGWSQCWRILFSTNYYTKLPLPVHSYECNWL